MTDRRSEDKPLVFVSYSKHDKAWKDKYLLVHLRGLEKAGLISPWSDDRIDRSGEWLAPLVQAMADASVAVCLLSPNYLDTDFCVKDEIPYLIERAEKDGLHLLLLLVEPCDFQAHPWLAKRQFFLDKGQSIAIDFKGREHLPFTWLSTHVREYLGARVQAPDELPVSDTIRDALAALTADAAKEPDVEPMPVVEEEAPRWPLLTEDRIDIERLPVTGAELFGRQAELQMLDKAWESEQTNIVALVAWGGVGKSTLLNKWVESLAADSYRGARRTLAWSFYSQGTNERVTSADAFIDEALRFFGDEDPALGSPWSRGERLAELVGREKALLLLDGMEPLQDKFQGIKDPALARLIECLAVRNDGLCVITTREPVKELSDFAETTLQKDLEFLSPEAGRALLRVKGIRGSDAELEAASAAFGNHALAINLLASFLQDCEGRHICHAAKIPDLADLDDPNHRHPRRVMAAFSERFGEGPELDLLHIMGLFDRPADAGCIAALRREPAVLGLTQSLKKLNELDWHMLIEKIRNLGLLAPAGHHVPDDLDAHPLVREHFAADLRREILSSWRRGHKILFAYLTSMPPVQTSNSFETIAHYFQAIRHGCLAGEYESAFVDVYYGKIIDHVWRRRHLNVGFLAAELAVLSNFFEELWDKPISSLDLIHQTYILNQVGFRLRMTGRFKEAINAFRTGVIGEESREDWGWCSIAMSNLSGTYLAIGDIEKAEEKARDAIEFSKRAEDTYRLAASELGLAIVLQAAGQPKLSLKELNKNSGKNAEFLSMEGKQLGWRYYPPLAYARMFHHIDTLLDLKNVAKAQILFEKFDNLLTKDADSYLEFAMRDAIASRIAITMNELAHAESLIQIALEASRNAGRLDMILSILISCVAIYRLSHENMISRSYLDQVMRIAKRCEMRLFQCDAHLEYARLDLAEGKRDTARTHLKSAAALVSACGYHRRDGEVAELEAALA